MRKILLILILAIGLSVQANSLVNTELRKSGADSVDLILSTSETYADNIVVRKKSDTEYVVLIPKLSGTAAPVLTSSVKEMVSNVKVQNIEDYTRVTITTKKPLNVRASAKKTSAQEQEYSKLIAKATSIKNKPAAPVSKPADPMADVVKSAQKAAPKAATVPKTPPKQAKPAPKKETPKAVEQPKQTAPVSAAAPPAPTVKTHGVAPITEKLLLEELPELPGIEDAPAAPETTSTFKPAGKLGNKHYTIIAGLLAALFITRFLKPKRRPQHMFGDETEPDARIPGVYAKDRYQDSTEPIDVSSAGWQSKYNLFKTAAASSADNPFGAVTAAAPVEVPQTEEVFDESETLDETFAETADLDEPEFLAPEAIDEILEEELDDDEIFEQELARYTSERPAIKGFASTPARIKNAHKRAEKLRSDRKMMNKEVDKQPFKPARSKITNPLVSGLSKLNPQPVMVERLGLIVKDTQKISDNKGFYLVDHNGEYSLVGKIHDRVFVIKKFDKPMDVKVQVRQDKDNVYMVRAGEFKSLVEVTDDNMGVLVEL